MKLMTKIKILNAKSILPADSNKSWFVLIVLSINKAAVPIIPGGASLFFSSVDGKCPRELREAGESLRAN